jgi:hypothetical protein
MAFVWVYSSQALTMPSGLPDQLVVLAGGVGQEGVVGHLGEDGDLLSLQVRGWRQ